MRVFVDTSLWIFFISIFCSGVCEVINQYVNGYHPRLEKAGSIFGKIAAWTAFVLLVVIAVFLIIISISHLL
jgi:hypothetical protein